MIVEETFYRPEEISRAPRQMPAETYNLAHSLLAQNPAGCVFVPIRSMQYLAVIDASEIVFVHREGQRRIEIAWQRLQPGGRQALTDPVGYECVTYDPQAPETMKRLQVEFLKALRELGGRREPPAAPARVIKLSLGKR